MGILSVFLKNKKDGYQKTQKLVNLFTPYFSNNVNPKLNDTFMACINTHAKHISKIKPKVFLNDVPTKNYLTKILCVSPNPIMEGGSFWEKAANNYYLENNVFIYIDWNIKNPNEPVKSLWIIDPVSTEVRADGEDIYLKFQLNGETITTHIKNVIHISRNVDTSGIFGTSSPAIDKVLKVINTNYEGIEQAIKTSAFLRFVLTHNGPLKEPDRKQKAEDFAKTYLAKDGTGIAYLDASTTLTQVNSEAKYANADEMKVFEEKILRYHNISEAILKGDFTEVQWQSYYETNIETFTNKLVNELMIKLLYTSDIAKGEKIIVQSNSLEVASTQTKINLVQNTKELGIFSANEYRALFGYLPIEGGDKRVMSLNFIDSDKASEYQLSKNKNVKEKSNET